MNPNHRLCFALTSVMITCAILDACSIQFDPAAIAYVTIDPVNAPRYLKDLGDIAEAHKLTPWTSSVTPDNGRTLYILEASGRALVIWSQNMVLSGHECPASYPIGNDPGQFEVVVHPAMWFRDWSRARTLFKAVRADLELKGYAVTSTPSAPCDPSRPKITPSG